MKKLHAFTLIELLVVISIIAIIAGFAMPALSRAMERARATEDSNNLASIGKGIVMYLNDNDDSMFSSTTSSGTDVWPAVLHSKYVKDWKAFRSPFDKASADRPKTETEPVPISYGLNEKVLGTFVGKWKAASSGVVLAAPAIDTSKKGAVAFDKNAMSDKNVKITMPTGTDLGTHQSRRAINVLFADSHVTQFEWSKYIRNATTEEKQRWDPMYEP